MKKIFLSILALAFLSVPSVSFAQNFDYNRAYSDYVFNTDLYNKSYAEYELARAAYMSTQTLAAKGQAQDATLKMLQNRDEMIKTYLTAIRLRIGETGGIAGTDQNLRYTQIDREVSWWNSHKARLSSAGTLEDLIEDSEEAEDHYGETEYAFYQGLSTILFGKLDKERGDLQKIVTDLKLKVEEIKNAKNKDTQKIERWIIEVDNRIERSRAKIAEARNIMTKMRVQDNRKADDFDEVKFTVKESQAYLKEAVNYLKQIITEIKTAD